MGAIDFEEGGKQSLTGLEFINKLGCLASEAQGSLFAFPTLGLQAHAAMPNFFYAGVEVKFISSFLQSKHFTRCYSRNSFYLSFQSS